MDTLDAYREVIQQVLTEYARVPCAYGDIQTETVFDRANDHYLLVNVGWLKDRRVHNTRLGEKEKWAITYVPLAKPHLAT